MNLFGLEGSGFLIAICVTLFLSGMIVFYVKQKFNETDHKIQHMLGIVQKLNSNNMATPYKQNTNEESFTGGHAFESTNSTIGEMAEAGGHVNFVQNDIDMNLLNNMPPIPEENIHQKINISESSEISSTTDMDDDDLDDDEFDDGNDMEDDVVGGVENNSIETELDVLDVEELENDTKVFDEIPIGNKVINIESMEQIKLGDFEDTPNDENTTDSDDNDASLEGDNNEGDNLDSVLLGMLDSIGKKNNNFKNENSDIHVVELDNLASDNHSPNLGELKVSEMRQMIKEKGMKVNNLSKLKKSECLEILSI